MHPVNLADALDAALTPPEKIAIERALRPGWRGVRLYMPANARRRRGAAGRFEAEFRAAAAGAGVERESVEDALLYMGGQHICV